MSSYLKTEDCRLFAEGGYHYTGGEVRVWVYLMADEIDRLREKEQELLLQLLSASNYIDTLGGVSKTYRSTINRITKET